ncbi:uncharacterized protein N0V96_006726 [Colletotrichum fioriniae]|uniref:uncharacterized protein n=1 Tax=Colletotrichum fioriniae TaxID=710243 RepID=UPI0032DB62A2|nr:hypothetical protein N0V96_006726 [Colletotrichum fioriniae]
MPADKSRKRKADKDLQRYYAVRVGLRPDKSFFTREEAQAFVEGKFVPAPAGEKPAPPRYYAVARGNFTGIFVNDWDTVSLAIKDAKGPKYKRFDTYTGALEFIREWGNEETIAGAEAGALNAGIKVLPRKPATSAATKAPKAKKETDDEMEKEDMKKKSEDDSVNPEVLNLPQIYIDGASAGNGTPSARAGVGVYFGPNDARNISEPLEGESQTNQRAELTAVLRALEYTSVTQDVQIWTDSEYAKNCVTRDCQKWMANGWKTWKGPVKNQDLIKAIIDHLKRREAAGTITSINWVRAHTAKRDPTSVGNKAADELATAGARKTLPTKSRRKLK